MSGPLQNRHHTMSRFEMNEEEMSGSEAARFIQDELLLDGIPAPNLAGLRTTYMGSEVDDLMLKNLVRYSTIQSHGFSNAGHSRRILPIVNDTPLHTISRTDPSI